MTILATHACTREHDHDRNRNRRTVPLPLVPLSAGCPLRRFPMPLLSHAASKDDTEAMGTRAARAALSLPCPFC